LPRSNSSSADSERQTYSLTSSRTASAGWWRSFYLLALEFVLERGLLNSQFRAETRRINVRIRTARRELRVFFRHVVHRGMRSQRNVRMSGMQELEALLILCDQLGIADEVRAGLH